MSDLFSPGNPQEQEIISLTNELNHHNQLYHSHDAPIISDEEYDRLFRVEDPTSEAGDFKEYLNPDSLKIIKGFAEASLNDSTEVKHFQFLRKGYYALDKD